MGWIHGFVDLKHHTCYPNQIPIGLNELVWVGPVHDWVE